MCLNLNTCSWNDHGGKHQPPARLRSASAGEIDLYTAGEGRPSLYYPFVVQKELEEAVMLEGQYVDVAQPATTYKVMEFQENIGASEGKPSKWVMVGTTNGEFHGRPISFALYQRKVKHLKECCD